MNKIYSPDNSFPNRANEAHQARNSDLMHSATFQAAIIEMAKKLGPVPVLALMPIIAMSAMPGMEGFHGGMDLDHGDSHDLMAGGHDHDLSIRNTTGVDAAIQHVVGGNGGSRHHMSAAIDRHMTADIAGARPQFFSSENGLVPRSVVSMGVFKDVSPYYGLGDIGSWSIGSPEDSKNQDVALQIATLLDENGYDHTKANIVAIDLNSSANAKAFKETRGTNATSGAGKLFFVTAVNGEGKVEVYVVGQETRAGNLKAITEGNGKPLIMQQLEPGQGGDGFVLPGRKGATLILDAKGGLSSIAKATLKLPDGDPSTNPDEGLDVITRVTSNGVASIGGPDGANIFVDATPVSTEDAVVKDIVLNNSKIGFELGVSVEGHPEWREVNDIIPAEGMNVEKVAELELRTNPETFGFKPGETQLVHVPIEGGTFRIELQRTSNPADVIAVFGTTGFTWNPDMLIDDNGNPVAMRSGKTVDTKGGVPENASTDNSALTRLTNEMSLLYPYLPTYSRSYGIFISNDGNSGVPFGFAPTNEKRTEGYIYFRAVNNKDIVSIYITGYDGTLDFAEAWRWR